MGPTIILDKSCIQSLSGQEIEFLYRYYTLNIPPILISEILGDLMKPDKLGALSGDEVIKLSNKLFQTNSAVSAHYRLLIINSLMGQSVKMDGRPHVQGKPVQEPDGKRGFLMEESIEEKAIHRWRKGLFSEAEAILSERWRESTKQVNLNQLKETYRIVEIHIPETDTFPQLVNNIDKLLLNPTPKFQSQLLTKLLHEFLIDQDDASKIFHRWEQGSFSSLKDFAPYAFYCFRVTLAFYLGLIRNFVTPRATNRLDLEYVYYLPFSFAFSSCDNFHQTFIPAFLHEDQSFVSGSILKDDLHKIVDQYHSLNPEQQSEWLKKNGRRPPDQEESITFKLWQKYIKPKEWIIQSPEHSVRSNTVKNNSTNNIMERFENLKPMDNTLENGDESNIDFIVRTRTISTQDPCPCGSGKKFKDCHLNPESKQK